MSTTIDQSVVEMRFDNKQFESGVSTTMSSLDKLKQKLRLQDASKGLENVSSAAKKVDMSGLGNGVESVSAKFSAMQVIGVTALANITNQAVNAGKRIVSALTIDPVRTGFSEYEMKMDSVKTIVNSTGRDLEDVNRLLEELNEYSDQTIYSFKDMTQNIGKFTNAGVNLEDAVLAIKGISNEAAVSGANAQEASRAMYNFSQALSAGYVKLIDWKSIENANMATKEFKQQLIDTAVELGVVTKAGDMYKTSTGKSFNATKNFNDVLQEQWMTTDVLIKTLGKYADQNTDIGKKAFAAAQEVTKLSQMWDVLKETAQSGWAKTWETIFGDLNQAKAIFTPLTNFFSGIITTIDDARNRMLEIALNFSKPWDVISDKLKGITKVVDKVKGVGKTLEDFQHIVDQVWLGNFNNRGDNPDRFDLLRKAGWDPRVVQTLVNLGQKSWQAGKVYKLTMEEVEAAHAKFGLTMETTKEETEEVTEAFNALSDETLKNAGLTEDEIALYRALESEAAKAGMSVSELADEMSKTSGRDMLIDSFKNIGGAIVDMGNAIKTAWINIFNPPSVEVLGIRLYGIIRTIKEFTESLRLTEEIIGENGEKIRVFTENGKKFQRIFQGIFAAVDIVLTVLGGPLKIVFKLVTQLLGYLGIGILDVAAFVGDAIVAFRDWIDSVLDFTKVFDKIVPPITNAIEAFKEWVRGLRDSENLPKDIAEGIASAFSKAVDAVKNFCKKIPEFFKSIPDFFTSLFDGSKALPEWMYYFEVIGETIGHLGNMIKDKIKEFLSRSEFAGISGDSIAGLVQGFKDGASKVWNSAVELVTRLVEKVKAFLGIHSPSTVFAAIGGFIIAGLIAGLQNGIPDSLGAIKDVFQPMLDWIKGIDFGAVFAAVLGVFGAGTAYKAVSGFSTLATAIASPLAGLGEVFEGTGVVLQKSAKPIAKVIKNTAKVVKSFSKVLNGIAFSIKADAIKTLGETLLMLVAAIAILTFFEPAELWNAVGVVAVLAIILVGLAFAMDKLSSASATIGKGGVDIQGLSSGLTGIGIAILLLGLTAKMLGSMKPEEIQQGLLGLVGIVAAVGALLIAFMKIPFGPADAEIVKGLGKTIKQIAIALLLMAVVVKLLGGMDRTTLIQGGIAITIFAGIMVGLITATKLLSGRENKNIATMGDMLLKIALAIGVMAIVAKMLGEMDLTTLIQGGLAIVAFGGIMVGLMAATKLISGSKNVDKIGDTLFKIALAIGVMAIVAKMLGGMDQSQLIKGGIAITAFAGIIVGLMAATKLLSGSKNIGKIGGAILAVSGAIAIMALTAFMLSMISWEGFAKGTVMVTVFAGLIVGLIAATKLVGADADKISKSIITIAVAIGVLGLIAVLLSLVPIENMKRGLTIVAVLTALMAGLIAVTGLSKDCMKTVIAIAGTILIMGGVLYLLSTLPVESTIGSAIALGLLMTVMAGVLVITSFVGKKAMDALKGVLVLTAMVLPLSGFVAVLYAMQSVQNAITNALALVTLATAVTLLMLPLILVGFLWKQAIIGVLALTAMMLPLSGFVVLLEMMNDVKNAETNANLLVNLMNVIGGLLIKLALVAPLAVIGVAALAALSGLMIGLGVLAVGIGALMQEFPALQSFLDTGIPVMEQLAEGLGSIIGKFVTSFAGEVMTLLPQLGLCLSQFMINATPFIVGAKMVDEKVLAGVGILTGAIVALTAADLLEGVASFLSGGSSFADLGTQLSQFMMNAMPFIMGASLITEETMSGIKSLAEAILILTAANVIEGLTSWLTGGSSLETFASQLPILGQGLSAFSDSLGAFTEEQLVTVNCAANAIKTLAAASAEIPNTGGLLGAIVGENDLGTFADQFPNLGTGLRAFLDNVGTFTEEQVATVNCAAEAIKSLASAASEIPNSGGWVGAIVGENDLAAFADQFPNLGTGLRAFLDNVGTFTDEQVATVKCGAEAVKSLAGAASEIPNSGGWIAAIVGENELGKFADQFPNLGTGLAGFLTNIGTFSEDQIATVKCGAEAVKIFAGVASQIPSSGGWVQKLIGENDLGSFASQFPKVGEGIKGFADKLGTFSSDQVATVNAGVNAVRVIAGLSNVDLNALSTNISGFGDQVVVFGSKLASFCSGMSTISSGSINLAVNNLRQVVTAITSISSENADTAERFGKSLQTLGQTGIQNFINAFEHSSRDVHAVGEKMISHLVNGMTGKVSDISAAMTKIAAGAINTLYGKYCNFYDAGDYLVTGFANGISANSYKAAAQARAMAKAAAEAAEDELDINSPSKVFRAIGYSVPEGFAMGIDKMSRLVTSSASSMGQTAISSVSKSISRIADAVNTDIDSQPTIRPVIDLSDVEAGANSIGNMLNLNGSVGMMANVGAISTAMNLRGQNGANDDVVSAINRLRNKLDNVGNTTYNVNGVTYDDGSNISGAVETLVRAARIERRV